MDDPQPPPGPAASPGPDLEELTERWTQTIQALSERPRDVELLLRAGQLSQDLGRRPEAYTYYLRAWRLDAGKTFLASKLRALAATPEEQEQVRKLSARPLNLQSAIGDIVRYPFRGKGLPVMALGSAFFWALRALGGFGGIYSLGLGTFASAYLALFYVDVCHSTVEGEDQLPDWPDPLRLQGVLLDVGKFALPALLSFLPFLLLLYWGTKEGGPAARLDGFLGEVGGTRISPGARAEPSGPAEEGPPASPDREAPAGPPARSPLPGNTVLLGVGLLLSGLIGLAYQPLSTLANIVFGSPWSCLNVPFVLRSMGAAPKSYAVCLATGVGFVLAMGALEYLARLFHVALVTGLFLSFLELYGITVQMRLLGVFYRINQTKLGWLAG